MPPRRPAATRDINDLRDQRVGLYCRVSLDQDGTEKSVNDQEADGREWVERVGALLNERHIYRDADRSASRFATKQRESFARLLEDIDNGELDIIWFWELSRSQRRLDVFAKLRDLCRDHGVLWVIRDRVYDPANTGDMLTAGVLSIVSENESEMTSQRVQRGKRMSAHAGRPAGRPPYGYKRIYHKETGAWERDVPDVFDSNGQAVEDSPAYIVREIFDRIAGGESFAEITRDLNDRGIKTTGDYRWAKSKVRYIALNPTYIAKRVHRVADHYENVAGERSKAILEGVDAGWPPLVDEATFWTVQRIVNDPTRRTYRGIKGVGGRGRPGRSLLSSVVRCGECGSKLVTRHPPRHRPRDEYMYACNGDRACVGILASALDEYVQRIVIAWLSDPATAADLTQSEDNSAAATQARGDLERGRAELQQLYEDVKAGTVSATVATLEEQRLLELVDDAEHRVQEAMLPPVLVGNIGPQAEAGWRDLEMASQRLIIRTIADVRVRRVGRGAKVPVEQRVEWRWLTGSDSDHVYVPAGRWIRDTDKSVLSAAATGTLLQVDVRYTAGLTRAGAHHLVDRLLQQGWITQEPAKTAKGRRTFRLVLTDAGRAALADSQAGV